MNNKETALALVQTSDALGLAARSIRLAARAIADVPSNAEPSTPTPNTPDAEPSPVPQVPPPTPDVTRSLFVFPGTNAWAWAQSNHGDGRAPLLDALSQQPVARWLGGWTADPYAQVKRDCEMASAANQVPVFIPYNIPKRDAGGKFSAGGLATVRDYYAWIDILCAAARDSGITIRPIAVLEPDALADMDSLNSAEKADRYDMLEYAVQKLTAAGYDVHLEIGHPDWIKDAKEAAGRLVLAGIKDAAGFAINTSNFQKTPECVEYARSINDILWTEHSIEHKKAVIDTSRNGVGFQGTWCNPVGVKIGDKPQFIEHDGDIAAYIWAKPAGESDGECGKGDPAPGTFVAQRAFEMCHNTWLMHELSGAA